MFEIEYAERNIYRCDPALMRADYQCTVITMALF